MNCLISSLRKLISLSTMKFLMINLALGMSVEGDQVLIEKGFTEFSMLFLNDAARNSAYHRFKIAASAKTLLTVCSLNCI